MVWWDIVVGSEEIKQGHLKKRLWERGLGAENEIL